MILLYIQFKVVLSASNFPFFFFLLLQILDAVFRLNLQQSPLVQELHDLLHTYHLKDVEKIKKTSAHWYWLSSLISFKVKVS